MTDMMAILKTIPLFQDLAETVLAKLIERIDERSYRVGDYLFREGERGEELFILSQGEVEIARQLGETSIPIARLGEGNFLGEGCLLDETPHTTFCRATVDSKALILTRQDLNEIFADDPESAQQVLRQAVRIIVGRLRSANLGYRGEVTALYEEGSKRLEHDLLGDRELLTDNYFGIQTLRAQENFHITGIPLGHFPNFVRALAMVKKAAALANRKLGDLDPEIASAICQACDEIIAGNLHPHFVVDMIQGGAGTSTNMNANEVIANRALEIMGYVKGDYQHCHPNNHVNLSQSTNDAYPTAIRLTILLSYQELIVAMDRLCYEFKQKAIEFSHIIKMGRTQLQDAVPMTLGQEFDAFYATVKEDISRIREVVIFFQEVNLGATAIGTGINADPDYASLAVVELSRIAGVDLVLASNLIEATSDMGAFVVFSGILKRVAVKISKICNDLRLLSSGPRAGFNEINLPPMQPGSSIMPGKVNPVIPEVVNQVAFQTIGNDLTVTLAAEAGQLQLNVMEPVIAFNLFQSIEMMIRAMNVLAERCIKGITANEAHCRELVENSIGIVTALNPYIGYQNATRIAKQALETGRSVTELVLEEGLLSPQELEEIMKPESMTRPRRVLRTDKRQVRRE